jgi:hypothetical protein
MSHYYINIPTHDEELIEYTSLYLLYEIPDIMGHIFSFLSCKDLISVGLTCRHWRQLTEQDTIWKPRYECLLKDRYDIQLQQPRGSYKQLFFSLSKSISKFDFHHDKIRQLAYSEKIVFPIVLTVCRFIVIFEIIIFTLLIFSFGPISWVLTLMIAKFSFTLNRALVMLVSVSFLTYSIISKRRHYNLVCQSGFTTASSTLSREIIMKEIMLIIPYLMWTACNAILMFGVLIAHFGFISWSVLASTFYFSVLSFIFTLIVSTFVSRNFIQQDRRMGIVFSVWSWILIFMGLQVMSISEKMTSTSEDVQSWTKVFGELYSMTYICLMVFMNVTCRIRFNWKRLSTGFFMLGGIEVIISWFLQFMWSERIEDGWRNSDMFMISSLGLHFYNIVSLMFLAAFFKIRT